VEFGRAQRTHMLEYRIFETDQASQWYVPVGLLVWSGGRLWPRPFRALKGPCAVA
jgi:hypothetical protein